MRVPACACVCIHDSYGSLSSCSSRSMEHSCLATCWSGGRRRRKKERERHKIKKRGRWRGLERERKKDQKWVIAKNTVDLTQYGLACQMCLCVLWKEGEKVERGVGIYELWICVNSESSLELMSCCWYYRTEIEHQSAAIVTPAAHSLSFSWWFNYLYLIGEQSG